MFDEEDTSQVCNIAEKPMNESNGKHPNFGTVPRQNWSYNQVPIDYNY